MIIINEDTLIHTDSSSDIIQHFGVKGMKWGQRRVISNRGAAASFQDQVKKSGHYAHESTITNGYINKLYNDGVRSSQKAQRFNALAKQAGLKG